VRHLRYGYFTECSYKEVADRLGISAKTVEKHIARGLHDTHSYLKRRYAGHRRDMGDVHRLTGTDDTERGGQRLFARMNADDVTDDDRRLALKPGCALILAMRRPMRSFPPRGRNS